MYNKSQLLTKMVLDYGKPTSTDTGGGGHVIGNDLPGVTIIVHTYFEKGRGTELTRKSLFTNTKICFYCLILNAIA